MRQILLIFVNNERTLGFLGEKEVRYAEVVNGGESFTMVVKLSELREALITKPFLVFKNAQRHYAIMGAPDTVPVASYRTFPTCSIDRTLLSQWFSKKLVISLLPNIMRRIIYVYNCSGHISTPELDKAADAINTEIRYFPPNSTQLLQKRDRFVIKNIKRVWTTHLERYKIDLVKAGKWKDYLG